MSKMIKSDPRQDELKRLLTGEGVRNAMRAVLPKLAEQVGTTPERIVGAALVAAGKNQQLLGCSPISILRALLECAQLGLTPGGVLGEAYLIPYGGECTLQIGVKGYQRLAFDAGRVKKIVGRVVYEHDIFEVEYEPDEKITHRPLMVGDPGKIVAAYAKFVFSDAEPQYEVLRRLDIEKIREQADSKKASPAWANWPDQMAIKSAIKRGAKRIDLSPTSPLMRAIEVDNRAEDGTQAEMMDIELPADVATAELEAAQSRVRAEDQDASKGAALEEMMGGPR